jgi:metal-responsive CopG/Arc/MetJ family transcriptional regulator
MKTIQVEIEESVWAEVERAAHALQMTREAFVRAAVERALQRRETLARERKHARGYGAHPQTPEEVSEWEAEQVWGEP